jgi:hypothetical protein
MTLNCRLGIACTALLVMASPGLAATQAAGALFNLAKTRLKPAEFSQCRAPCRAWPRC